MTSPGFSSNIIGYIIEWVYDELDFDEMLQNKKYLYKTWDEAIKQVFNVTILVQKKHDVYVKNQFTDDNSEIIKCNTDGSYRFIDIYYKSNDELMGSIYIITIYSK
jgi:hypothetical protein